MSIKLMNAVWYLTEISVTDKFILLSLADQANDAGKCWPSISNISRRCSLSRRAIINVLHRLEQYGYLSKTTSPGLLTIYTVTPDRNPTSSSKPVNTNTRAPSAPVHLTTSTGASDAITPIRNHHRNLKPPKGGIGKVNNRRSQFQRPDTFTSSSHEPKSAWHQSARPRNVSKRKARGARDAPHRTLSQNRILAERLGRATTAQRIELPAMGAAADPRRNTGGGSRFRR